MSWKKVPIQEFPLAMGLRDTVLWALHNAYTSQSLNSDS